ncbi:class I SAM-dependent RNA methyltransferase [Aureimonas flava]|uniref:Class I SAM-dependent RNA methyltransferase n=1 Tax=Aureimonas flava TaxID=2320271 RepID=A0A3A1WXC4_9HYPH|nr:class I SAM-dependent RNA methyltransferase [Aureimonas flava]RIY03379.1 class I SAM-dependent RNA methyltransferase [Aureimonas flava]
MSEQVAIDALGTRGDGIAREPSTVFVPFALPGETVTIERQGGRGQLLSVDHASPERRDAPCPHFGRCGGCDLQHLGDRLYAHFKRDLVVDALAREGLSPEVAPLEPCAPGSRRRAVFTAVRAGPRVLFGFHEALSHRIAPIETCLVAVPEIVARLKRFERLATLLIDRKRELRMTVTRTQTGLDVAIEQTAKLSAELRQSAIAWGAEDQAVARLSVDGETLIENRVPTIDVAGVAVPFPAGAFLQAVAGAENRMAEIALAHLAPSKAVADLFCGFGAFTLRLARHHAVHAAEFDAPALASLEKARRAASGLKPVTVERRDLFRRPLTAKELARFDGVLFDPPRAGAEAQAREIAASGVRRVAAVSCNPVTLARDAAILVAGGYRLLRVTPIDQFLWSHHVEAVALFER